MDRDSLNHRGSNSGLRLRRAGRVPGRPCSAAHTSGPRLGQAVLRAERLERLEQLSLEEGDGEGGACRDHGLG
eukprot:scaffold63219_cov47-Phaeocystis_antarctica.AAC.1